MTDNDALITEARALIEHMARSAPSGHAELIRTGRASDEKATMLYKLVNALEQTTCERDEAEDTLQKIREWAFEWGDRYAVPRALLLEMIDPAPKEEA